jgi:hypothetical protein
VNGLKLLRRQQQADGIQGNLRFPSKTVEPHVGQKWKVISFPLFASMLKLSDDERNLLRHCAVRRPNQWAPFFLARWCCRRGSTRSSRTFPSLGSCVFQSHGPILRVNVWSFCHS